MTIRSYNDNSHFVSLYVLRTEQDERMKSCLTKFLEKFELYVPQSPIVLRFRQRFQAILKKDFSSRSDSKRN